MMTIVDVLILAAILALAGLVIFFALRRRKSGCSAGCVGCSQAEGCAHHQKLPGDDQRATAPGPHSALSMKDPYDFGGGGPGK